MALVHGAAGIMYFCHRFQPSFSETDCLEDAPTRAALLEINAQLGVLAPVLNTPSVSNGVSVVSSNSTIVVDTMLKRHADATYLFAVAMRDGTTNATFALRDFPPVASAEVLGEGRSIAVAGGTFSDSFEPYAVHLYEIPHGG